MSAGGDLALLRFLRARVDETAVLNDAQGDAVPPEALPRLLVEAAGALRAAAVSPDGRAVDYRSLAGHPAFRRLEQVAAGLVRYPLETLAERRERLAFWLNVFNALAIEAVVRLHPGGSIRETPGFFRRAAYRIGGHRFSLEQIEQGVLRGNRSLLPGLPPPFPSDDPRLAFAVRPPDPLVHFALNCATRSCPALRVYHPESVEAELELAACEFVRDTSVVRDGRLQLSAIFSFYLDDFGGIEELGGWLDRYLRPADAAAAREALRSGEVAFDPYDWSLNAAGPEPSSVPVEGPRGR